MKLLKQFWIQFLILERCYDTFKVVPDILDSRLVFPEGIIVDTLNGGINVQGIANLSPEEVLRTFKPWFITVVTKKLLYCLKEFEPTEVEICFCFALILFNIADIAGEISAQTAFFAKSMVETIYDELNSYYAAEFSQENVLKRIVELMSLIATAEKIAIQRKEEKVMQEVFNIFKTDIFLDGIFED